ncbi:Phosphate transport regulator (distant similar to PhoU) [Roseibacterium elongatum DSM 19469]|uniref:Phosphate transport regulator (Distant similar to PhoU) n=1 Tax=Roseicyclus elongatus DSM 19469 TaxID=1294273 RepID=W8SK97_9RHOB|nr:Phosphate transport regulator (distant similar to PhoU) [Roseibacterium elongatum DSM 19469]
MKLIRYIKYLFLVLVAIGLVVLAMANRDPVTLTILPAELALWTGVDYAIELPLFLVILGGVVTGVLLGFVWEWLREHRHRAEAATNKREARKLEREVKALKGRDNEGKDEVLALVEDAGTAR